MKSIYIYNSIRTFYTITKSFSFHYRGKQNDTYTQGIASVLVIFFFIWCTSAAFAMNPNRSEGTNTDHSLLGSGGNVEEWGDNGESSSDDLEETGNDEQRLLTNTPPPQGTSFGRLEIMEDGNRRSRSVRRNCLNTLRCVGSTVVGAVCGMGIGGFISFITSEVLNLEHTGQYIALGCGIGGWAGSMIGCAIGVTLSHGNQIHNILGCLARSRAGYSELFGRDSSNPPSPPPSDHASSSGESISLDAGGTGGGARGSVNDVAILHIVVRVQNKQKNPVIKMLRAHQDRINDQCYTVHSVVIQEGFLAIRRHCYLGIIERVRCSPYLDYRAC